MVMSAKMARELGRSSKLAGRGRQTSEASEASDMPGAPSTDLGTVEEVSEDTKEETTTAAAEAKKHAKKEKRKAQKGKRVASSPNAPASGSQHDGNPMVDV